MNWGTSLFIAILAVFTFFILYLLIRPAQQVTPTGPVQQVATTKRLPTYDEGIIHAIVVDLKQPEGIVAEKVLAGDDPILMIRAKEPVTPPEQPNLFLFNNLSSLAQFDIDWSGYIDANDEIFPYLYLAYFDAENKQLHYYPLSKSPIKAIHIDHDHLATELANNTQHVEMKAGEVVLDDSTRRLVMLIRLPKSLLQNITMIPDDIPR